MGAEVMRTPTSAHKVQGREESIVMRLVNTGWKRRSKSVSHRSKPSKELRFLEGT